MFFLLYKSLCFCEHTRPRRALFVKRSKLQSRVLVLWCCHVYRRPDQWRGRVVCVRPPDSVPDHFIDSMLIACEASPFAPRGLSFCVVISKRMHIAPWCWVHCVCACACSMNWATFMQLLGNAGIKAVGLCVRLRSCSPSFLTAAGRGRAPLVRVCSSYTGTCLLVE